jgi:hypothetical protein
VGGGLTFIVFGRLEQLENQVQVERMEKDETEGLVIQAEEALVRMRKAKDATEEARQCMENEVEALKGQVKELTQRNDELESYLESSKVQITELACQRARLTKLCGLRTFKSPFVSPRTRSPKSPESLLLKSPASDLTISSSQSVPKKSTAESPFATSTPMKSGLHVCNTSYSPITTQHILQDFVEGNTSRALSESPLATTESLASSILDCTRQGHLTVFSASAPKKSQREGTPSPQGLTRQTNTKITIPLSTEFGRHSAERMQRHKERMSHSPDGSQNTPRKHEQSLTARSQQNLNSSMAKAEPQINKKEGDEKKKTLTRRSLTESKQSNSRERPIREQAGAVPEFVAEALRKQMVNKNSESSIDQNQAMDKENLLNCMSPPPAAVEISMEATKANVSMSGTTLNRLRRATISSPLHEM